MNELNLSFVPTRRIGKYRATCSGCGWHSVIDDRIIVEAAMRYHRIAGHAQALEAFSRGVE